MALGLGLLLAGCVRAGPWLEWFTRPSFSNEIIIFLTLSTTGLYGFVTRQRGLHPADFVKIYLGATVLRILFFGGFIFALIRLDASGAWKNATLFLVSYFLFTTLEVLILFKQINSQKPSKE